MRANSHVESSEMKREKEMSDSLHVRAKPGKTNPDRATAAATSSFPCCALNASRICQLCAPAHHARRPLAGVLISFALRIKIAKSQCKKLE